MYIAKLAINDTIDSTWIGSLASYWGGILGGMISGTLAFIGVFYTIRYYKESDEQKEKAAIQPFLNVTIASGGKATRGFSLGKADLKEKKTALKKAEKEVATLEAKKAKADAKATEEAKKAEAESVLKKLLASGMSADEILEKLK